MKKFFKNNWFVFLILISLGTFIFYIDKRLSQSLLKSQSFSEHIYLIGVLLIGVSILLAVIINIDNKS